MKHSGRTFVKDVDFVTTVSFGRDGKAQDNVPNIGCGPVMITDLILKQIRRLRSSWLPPPERPGA